MLNGLKTRLLLQAGLTALLAGAGPTTGWLVPSLVVAAGLVVVALTMRPEPRWRWPVTGYVGVTIAYGLVGLASGHYVPGTIVGGITLAGLLSGSAAVFGPTGGSVDGRPTFPVYGDTTAAPALVQPVPMPPTAPPLVAVPAQPTAPPAAPPFAPPFAPPVEAAPTQHMVAAVASPPPPFAPPAEVLPAQPVVAAVASPPPPPATPPMVEAPVAPAGPRTAPAALTILPGM